MPNNLNEPLLSNGILNTNYFNGRILDADALLTDQKANRQQHGQLGHAVGTGVVWGLEVAIDAVGSTATTPILTIQQGLAINPLGQALELRITPPGTPECTNSANTGTVTSLSLALATVTDSPTTSADLFAACSVPAPTVNTLAGVYFLVMSPASGFQASAPAMSQSLNGASAGCGSRYAVEGVTFRLVGYPSDGTDTTVVATLQNRLAYRCFGAQEQLQGLNGGLSFAQDPFDFVGTYGAIDALRSSGALTDCDVTLALLYQTDAGLQFCDMWAARRPAVPPTIPSIWPLHVGHRRVAEGMAMFLQYQDQIASLYQTLPGKGTTLSSVQAKTYFQYLPPAGYLHIKKGEFDRDTFFTGLTLQRFTLDPGYMRLLIDSSWHLDPIDLTASTPPAINVYESADTDGYLVYIRADGSKPIVAPPPPPATTGTAAILVFASLADELDLPNTEIAKRISVVARGSSGTSYSGVYFYPVRFARPIGGPISPMPGHFTIDNLPADTYSVRVSAALHLSVVRSVTVAAGDQQVISVSLTPRIRFGSVKPPAAGLAGNWLKFQWYQQATVIPKQFDFQTRPDLAKWVVQPDPPPDVVTQMQDWAEFFQQQYPDAPIDPTDMQVLVDPTYTPKEIANDFYAYLQFGANGAYVPLVLTATDKALDRPVSLDKGGLPGVDADIISRLAGAGVQDLSVLASSPKSLIANTLGLSTDAGHGLIAAGQAAVGTLKGSLLQFNGVTSDLMVTLSNLKITDGVSLANADPAVLAQSKIDPAFASRLVEEARLATPPETWQLSAPSLGLTAGEIQTLKQKGITTLGQFATAAQNSSTASTLGVAQDRLTKVVTVYSSVSSTLAAKRIASAPVSSLTTVDSGTAIALAAAGVSNLKTLATTDVSTLASKLGGQTELAGRILAEAQSQVKTIAG